MPEAGGGEKGAGEKGEMRKKEGRGWDRGGVVR